MGNRQQLEHKKFHTNKEELTVRETEHWKRLRRQVVEPPLEIFRILRIHLDTFLCYLL